MIHSYGRKFLHHDSAVALQYYMLAAVVRGNSIAVKGQVRATTTLVAVLPARTVHACARACWCDFTGVRSRVHAFSVYGLRICEVHVFLQLLFFLSADAQAACGPSLQLCDRRACLLRLSPTAPSPCDLGTTTQLLHLGTSSIPCLAD